MPQIESRQPEDPDMHSKVALRAAPAAAMTLMLASVAVAAIDISSPQRAAGQWDLTLADTPRKCRITLRPDIAAQGYAVAMPAGCRRALPILASVGTWTVPRSQRLELDDADGKAVLEFEPAGEDTLTAKGPQGETYALVSANAVKVAQIIKPAPLAAPGVPGFQNPAAAAPPPPPGPAKPAVPAVVAATPAKPAAPLPAALALKPGDVAGRYNILRDGGKDSGCMLTLDDKAQGLKGLKANLAPACRDQGMVIFDPKGWSLERGRLVLTARKGHQTHMDLQADGMWLKDPKEGKSLAVKKF